MQDKENANRGSRKSTPGKRSLGKIDDNNFLLTHLNSLMSKDISNFDSKIGNIIHQESKQAQSEEDEDFLNQFGYLFASKNQSLNVTPLKAIELSAQKKMSATLVDSVVEVGLNLDVSVDKNHKPLKIEEQISQKSSLDLEEKLVSHENNVSFNSQQDPLPYLEISFNKFENIPIENAQPVINTIPPIQSHDSSQKIEEQSNNINTENYIPISCEQDSSLQQFKTTISQDKEDIYQQQQCEKQEPLKNKEIECMYNDNEQSMQVNIEQLQNQDSFMFDLGMCTDKIDSNSNALPTIQSESHQIQEQQEQQILLEEVEEKKLLQQQNLTQLPILLEEIKEIHDIQIESVDNAFEMKNEPQMNDFIDIENDQQQNQFGCERQKDDQTNLNENMQFPLLQQVQSENPNQSLQNIVSLSDDEQLEQQEDQKYKFLNDTTIANISESEVQNKVVQEDSMREQTSFQQIAQSSPNSKELPCLESGQLQQQENEEKLDVEQVQINENAIDVMMNESQDNNNSIEECNNAATIDFTPIINVKEEQQTQINLALETQLSHPLELQQQSEQEEIRISPSKINHEFAIQSNPVHENKTSPQQLDQIIVNDSQNQNQHQNTPIQNENDLKQVTELQTNDESFKFKSIEKMETEENEKKKDIPPLDIIPILQNDDSSDGKIIAQQSLKISENMDEDNYISQKQHFEEEEEVRAQQIFDQSRTEQLLLEQQQTEELEVKHICAQEESQIEQNNYQQTTEEPISEVVQHIDNIQQQQQSNECENEKEFFIEIEKQTASDTTAKVETHVAAALDEKQNNPQQTMIEEQQLKENDSDESQAQAQEDLVIIDRNNMEDLPLPLMQEVSQIGCMPNELSRIITTGDINDNEFIDPFASNNTKEEIEGTITPMKENANILFVNSNAKANASQEKPHSEFEQYLDRFKKLNTTLLSQMQQNNQHQPQQQQDTRNSLVNRVQKKSICKASPNKQQSVSTSKQQFQKSPIPTKVQIKSIRKSTCKKGEVELYMFAQDSQTLMSQLQQLQGTDELESRIESQIQQIYQRDSLQTKIEQDIIINQDATPDQRLAQIVKDYSLTNLNAMQKGAFLALLQTHICQTIVQAEEVQEELNHNKISIQQTQTKMHEQNLQNGCVVGGPPGCGKSLVYMVLAQVLSGLTVVVTSNVQACKDRVKLLPQNISQNLAWAALTMQMPKEQKLKVMGHVQNGHIQLLFVQSEIFSCNAYFAFPAVALLVYDEAQVASEQNAKFKYTQSMISQIRLQLKPNQLYAMCTQMVPNETMVDVADKLKLPRENLFSCLISSQNDLTKLQQYLSSFIQFQNKIAASQQNTASNEAYYYNFGMMDWARDEDKNKALIAYLRHPKIPVQNKHRFVILCDSKRICEETTLLLNKNGFKAVSLNGTTKIDIAKQHIVNFLKDNIDILVVPSGHTFSFLFDRMVKQQIMHLLHYNLPRSIEAYLEDVGGINPEKTRCLGFLKDQDYFGMREQICAEIVEQGQVKVLLQKIFEDDGETEANCNQAALKNLISSLSHQDRMSNVNTKQPIISDYSINQECNETKELDDSFISLPRFKTSIKQEQEHDNKISSEIASPKQSDVIGTQSLSNICYLEVNKLSQELDLKKEVLMKMISELQTLGLVQAMPLIPLHGAIRISPSTTLAKIVQQYPIIEDIVKNARFVGGGYKFNLLEATISMQQTIFEIAKFLKKLTQDKLIVFDIIEECLCLKVIAKPECLSTLIQSFKSVFEKADQNLIQKLDIMYLAIKMGSYQTTEHMWKYAKYKPLPEQSLQKNNQAIKIQTTHNIGLNKSQIISKKDKSLNKSIIQLAKANKPAVIQKFELSTFINKYMSITNLSIDSLFCESKTAVRELQPFSKALSQREKSTIMGVMSALLNEKLSQLMTHECISMIYNQAIGNEENTEILNQIARNIVKVLQGIITTNDQMIQFKGYKDWGKYQKNEYFELISIAKDTLLSYQVQDQQMIIRKKVKL